LDSDTYGGGFIYHMADNMVHLGLVVGLDYENPTLSPYGEFQKFKTHPYVQRLLEGGERLSYGARALNEGGVQSIPILSLPGVSLLGCGAGFLNVARLKGSHLAIKSGMLAAQALLDHLVHGKPYTYPERVLSSPQRARRISFL
jgi:electron-transferring-flavoprotein dehydrogenase